MQRRLWALSAVLVCTPLGLFLLYQDILDQQRLTWRDYLKVREGMTQPEVEAVLGPPQSIDATTGGGKEVRWIGRKHGMIYVEFSTSGAMVRKFYIEEARDYRLSFFPQVRE
jgi:hypothetical protein